MPQGTDAVKVIEGALALGFSLSEAVQRALESTLSAFAERRGFTVQAVSMCLGRYEGRVYAPIRDALAEDLSIPREYVDRLIDSASPAPDESAAADRGAA